MLHGARQDVSDRLDAAVRVPRETREEVPGVVVPEVVEEQERVEIRGVAEAEGALKSHASALQSGFRAAEPFDWANRHCGSPLVPSVYFIYKLSASGLIRGRASADKP